jgi:cystathionine gamma-synthase
MNLKNNTICVHGSTGPEPKTGAVSYPIYQSATFGHPALYESTGYDYSRESNPTRDELEKTINLLEKGTAGFAFSSGMSAITTVINIFKPGDHVIVSDDLYGGTYRLFSQIYRHYGIEFDFIDTSNLEDIFRCKKINTKGIFIETPSNPTMKVSDIKAITDFAKELDILTIVDNTFLTPYFQQPLTLGADIVIHSGTKYLGGHNDTLAGFIIVNHDDLKDKVKFLQKSIGAALSPFDSWLMLRGIKTLAIRLERHQENAFKIVHWLKTHKLVEQVYYVGLEDHKGFEISKKQTSGYGGMISFTVKSQEIAKRV